MIALQKGRIFISYRRADSAGYAGRIYDRLTAHFGKDAVFMDVDTIEAGLDFVVVLRNAVQSCDVLVALIGRQWINIKDENGKRRLDNSEDFVRIEIAAALDRDIRVIPILVDGASIPNSAELPDNLKSLARRNALQVNHHSFNADAHRLISQLELALKAAEESKIIKAQRLREEKERKQRKEEIDKLLESADLTINLKDWNLAREKLTSVLELEPTHTGAREKLDIVQRKITEENVQQGEADRKRRQAEVETQTRLEREKKLREDEEAWARKTAEETARQDYAKSNSKQNRQPIRSEESSPIQEKSDKVKKSLAKETTDSRIPFGRHVPNKAGDRVVKPINLRPYVLGVCVLLFVVLGIRGIQNKLLEESPTVIATADIIPNTILEVSGTANPTTYSNSSQAIRFSFVIRNVGSTTLGPAQFSISDARMGTVNCLGADTILTAGASISCSGNYTTTESDRNVSQLSFNLVANGGGATYIQPVQVNIMNTNVVDLQLIDFSGTTEITRSGMVIASKDEDRYRFAAMQGQTLEVILTSTGGLELAILPESANVAVMKPQNDVLTFAGNIPSNGDYFVDVVNLASVGKSYSLQISLSPHVVVAMPGRVFDVYPGATDGAPSYMTAFNNVLYFNATGLDKTGEELWKYDTASNMIERVADIYLGTEGSTPSYLTVYNGLLYFCANGNDGAGMELWRFSGKDIGRLTDINAGGGDASPSYLTEYQDFLYFSALGSDGAGVELWRTDGTMTERVTDIFEDSGDTNPAYLTVYKGLLYFSANGNDGAGVELWRYNGVDVGRLTDINPGSANANPSYLTEYNGLLYFSANGNDGAGVELWRTDGTMTARVIDINPGVGDANPTYLTVYQNALYFSANANDGTGYELWKFDGTDAKRVSDINKSGDSFPSFLTVYDNHLYFQADGGDGAGRELWRFKP